MPFASAKEYYTTGMESITKNPSLYLLASIIEIILLILIFYKWNLLGLSSSNPPAVALIIIVFAFIQLTMYLFLKEKDSFKDNDSTTPLFGNILIKIILTIFTLIIMVVAVYAILIYGSSTLIFLFHLVVYIVVLLIAIAIIYLTITPFIKEAKNKDSNNSFTNLIGRLIMYFPSLILDTIDWVRYQYKITTHPVWLLLGGEALLLTLNILVPRVFSFISNQQGKILLNEPVYLDKQHIIGDFDTLYKDTQSIKYKFSISAWFWINPQPPNTSSAYTKFTNILDFGKKPSFEYNSLENKLRVSCNIHKDNTSIIYETTDIKYQTWNNIVINYDAGSMDIFLNGVLVGSRPDIVPYMTFENITVGSKKGIQGGITNVIYRNNIMQSREIEYIYKTMKLMPIPVL